MRAVESESARAPIRAFLQFDRAKEPPIPQRLRPLAALPDHAGGIECAMRPIGKRHHQLERHDGADGGELEAVNIT